MQTDMPKQLHVVLGPHKRMNRTAMSALPLSSGMAQMQSGIPWLPEGRTETPRVFKQVSYMATLREGTGASRCGHVTI